MRTILFCILMLVSSAVYSFPFMDREEDETKEIVELESNSAENDRSLKLALCYIDRDINNIEFRYAGIGIPFVSIYDFSGVQICSQVGFSDYGSVVLPLPISEGMYQIVIRSSQYSGAGVFCIY